MVKVKKRLHFLYVMSVSAQFKKKLAHEKKGFACLGYIWVHFCNFLMFVTFNFFSYRVNVHERGCTLYNQTLKHNEKMLTYLKQI